MFVNKDEQDSSGNYCLLKTAFPVTTIAAASYYRLVSKYTVAISSVARNSKGTAIFVVLS